MKRVGHIVACVVALLVWAVSVCADLVFQMTTIGNPGNPADTTGSGSVGYTYQIGMYEVTVGQYTEFLNAKAQSDPNALYNPLMETGPLGAFITRSGTDGDYTYTAVSGKEDEPVRFVSFWDGMRLANWLHNGQGDGDTETGSYDLSQGPWLERSSNATWVIPSEDEWYKAAYYDPATESYYVYPNGSSSVPPEPGDVFTPREMNFGDDPYWDPDGPPREYFTSIGETTGYSPYGVFDLGGNAEEWTDTLAWPSSARILRGGGLFSHENDLRNTHQQPKDPTDEGDHGFRLAFIIPEPRTILLLLCALPVLIWLKRR